MIKQRSALRGLAHFIAWSASICAAAAMLCQIILWLEG